MPGDIEVGTVPGAVQMTFTRSLRRPFVFQLLPQDAEAFGRQVIEAAAIARKRMGAP